LAIKDELLLGAIDDLLRTMPSAENFTNPDDDILNWLGRAGALIAKWKGPTQFVHISAFKMAADTITTGANKHGADGSYVAVRQIRRILSEIQTDLQLNTDGPLAVPFGAGKRYEYFDEVRKRVEAAAEEVFFVDPFLDADFVAKYLPYVKSGVLIRLLTRRHLTTLVPAVEEFAKQNGHTIQVRADPNFHDRYVFIDRAAGYHSGASFKDGAIKAPTTLTQITDAFDVVLKTYEDMWTQGRVVR
jgi:hypothetical protein